jgi:predicted DNA-binding transcriptional regulator YafY
VLDLVAQAWFQRRVLRCRYHAATGSDASRRDLEVYFFELNRVNHEAYVLAFDRTKRRRVLSFKLARMSEVQLLDEPYEVPASFDPAEALAGSFGIVMGEPVWVTLRVAPSVARRFRETREPRFEVQAEEPDGALVVRVRATLDADGRALELIPWLIGWAAGIEVLEPVEVRAAVAEGHRAAAALYA